MLGVHQGVSRFGIFFRSTSEYYREAHWAPYIPNAKEFFKNIHSLLTDLSFKLQLVLHSQSIAALNEQLWQAVIG